MFIIFIPEIKKIFKKFYYIPKKIYLKTVNGIIAIIIVMAHKKIINQS